MNRLFHVVCAPLAVALLAAAHAPAADGAGKLRLAGPKYVYGPQAEFLLSAPAEMDGATVTVAIAGPGGVKAGKQVKLTASRGVLRRRGAPPPREATGRADFDARTWADGEYTARAEMPSATTTRAATQPAKPQAATNVKVAFRVIREMLVGSFRDEALRGEMGVWLDHVNRWGDSDKMKPSWSNAERALAQPALLYGGLRGVLLRSYFNPQLGRLQPYSVHVPKAYDPNKPMALMVLLHGSGFDYLNILSDMKAGQELETNPLLLANAGAFRQQEFRHMALNDVLWVVQDMKKKYNVDADRVYLQGISLGGRGSIEIAALRPEIWAATSPQGTYGCMAESSDPAWFADAEPFTRWQIARWDIRSYLPNVRHVPMQIALGWKDTTTPPLNALTFRHLVNKRFGGKAEAIGFDTGHNISMPHYKWSDTRAWLLKHKRVIDPPVVTARTATLRYNRFYWVTIDQLECHWKMAQVQASLDGKAGELTVRTDNVAALTLEPPRAVEKVDIDGVALAPPAATRRLRFARASGTWKLLDPSAGASTAPATPVKRHGVSGPIWDFMNGRCVFVYGTGGTAAETQLLRRIAEALARIDAAWGDPLLPVAADHDVTDEQKRTCNLALVGDARTNRLVAGRSWPFDLKAAGEGKGIRVFDRTFVGPSDCLQFIYPSPFGPDTYVYVVCPARYDARPAVLDPAGTWDIGIWTDWLVRSYEAGEREGRRPFGRRSDLAAGTFDSQWKLLPVPGPLVQPHPMNWE